MENNFWSTTQGKATIKFGAWMIFIIGIIALSLFSNNKNDDNSSKNNVSKKDQEQEIYNFETYEKMQTTLLNSKYDYKYVITKKDDNSLVAIYSGSKNNNEDKGFLETSEGIIKYSIKAGIVNKVVLDKEEPLENLYNNINESFLKLDVLFTNLKEYLYNVEKNENKRNITYNKEGYKVTVKTDLNNITNILITTDELSYDLEFTNISNYDNIDNK